MHTGIVLGLTYRNAVRVYQDRCDDMPPPVREFGDRRVKLWLRPEIDRWAADLIAQGRARRKRAARRWRATRCPSALALRRATGIPESARRPHAPIAA